MNWPSWFTTHPGDDDAIIDSLIAEKGMTRYTFTGHDEELQQRTQQRRLAADAIRARAAKVETGAMAAKHDKKG